MNERAPYFPKAGFQVLEKTPLKPTVVNQSVDCFVVDMAMRTRITSTSSPDASART